MEDILEAGGKGAGGGGGVGKGGGMEVSWEGELRLLFERAISVKKLE